jgi:uncharacterized protein with HEPN domain
MYDIELVSEVLHQMLELTRSIAKRCAPLTSAEDFVSSEAGLEKLDAICMQLIALGESVKYLDKVTQGELLPRYSQIEWKRVMGMRDILSHHYFDIDAELVYSVCANHITLVARAVEAMLADLEDAQHAGG